MNARRTTWVWGIAPLVLAVAVGCGGNAFVEVDGGTAAEGGVDGSAGDASGSHDGGGGDAGASDGSAHDAGDATSPDAGRVPANHRPDDSQCSQPAAAGDCPISGGSFTCSSDTACSMGTNGRCIESSGGGALTCFCTYDTCAHDTDCPSGELCACHGSAFAGGAGNTCTQGNCRVDSDCGSGGYCSPSHGTTGCGGLTGYYCHTASDGCVDDSDCSSGPASVCAWSMSEGHWACAQQQLCP